VRGPSPTGSFARECNCGDLAVYWALPNNHRRKAQGAKWRPVLAEADFQEGLSGEAMPLFGFQLCIESRRT
jgi:hypothetical protein